MEKIASTAARTYEFIDETTDQEWESTLTKEFVHSRVLSPTGKNQGHFSIRPMINGGKFGGLTIGPVQIEHSPEDVCTIKDDALQVLIIHQGGGRIVLDGIVYKVTNGDVVFRRAAQPSLVLVDTHSQVSALWIPVSEIQAAIPALHDLGPVHLDGNASLSDIILRMACVFRSQIDRLQSPSSLAMDRGFVQTVLSAYLDSEVKTERLSPVNLQWHRCMQYIDSHLCDCELSPKSCATALRISLRYFFRILEIGGVRFRSYVQEQRLIRVRETLEHTSGRRVNLTQIAFQHGFNNASHFSQVFRLQYGMSPSDFVKALSGAA